MIANVANTPPPEYVLVNGVEYGCNTDFMVWADIIVLAQGELLEKPKNDSEILANWRVLAEMQRLAFNRVLDEPAGDVFNAMLQWLKGYPKDAPSREREEDESGAKTFSLKHDMNLIVLAIRNQSGIDLTYARKAPFHWWLFLLEFQSLDDSHLITNIMRWRAYDGEDKELCRRRDRVALPKEYTRSEQAMIEELDALFPNT